MKLQGWLYRTIMRITHRYHWHYAPPIYPGGDTQLWCKWCGFRQTIKRSGHTTYILPLAVGKGTIYTFTAQINDTQLVDILRSIINTPGYTIQVIAIDQKKEKKP